MTAPHEPDVAREVALMTAPDSPGDRLGTDPDSPDGGGSGPAPGAGSGTQAPADPDWWPWSEPVEDAPPRAPQAHGRRLMIAIYTLLAVFVASLVVWGVVLVVTN
jgi:hypothetical protein